MDAVDRNFLRMSGRIRALEQLMTVLVIDWADRDDADPMVRLAAARRNSMLTIQMQERPIDDPTDFEAGAMAEALSEIFADATAWFQKAQRGE